MKHLTEMEYLDMPLDPMMSSDNGETALLTNCIRTTTDDNGILQTIIDYSALEDYDVDEDSRAARRDVPRAMDELLLIEATRQSDGSDDHAEDSDSSGSHRATSVIPLATWRTLSVHCFAIHRCTQITTASCLGSDFDDVREDDSGPGELGTMCIEASLPNSCFMCAKTGVHFSCPSCEVAVYCSMVRSCPEAAQCSFQLGHPVP